MRFYKRDVNKEKLSALASEESFLLVRAGMPKSRNTEAQIIGVLKQLAARLKRKDGLNPYFETDGNGTLAGKETASGKETIYERVP